jgi:hypothetical protein
LLDAAWLGRPELSLAAANALGQIGPAARSAAYSLATLLKVSDEEMRPVIVHALAKIAPDVAWDLAIAPEAAIDPTPEAPPATPPQRKPWQDSLAAATALHDGEAQVRMRIEALIEEGFFADEQDTDALSAALAAKGHAVEFAQLFAPLLDLTAANILWRRKSDLGRWLYSARRKVPQRVQAPA